MVERDILGEVKRASFQRLPGLLGIDGETLKELAERVRQFDYSQSNETRQRRSLEKIAEALIATVGSVSERQTRQFMREREVQALELMAVAMAYPHEELRETHRYDVMLFDLRKAPDPMKETRDE